MAGHRFRPRRVANTQRDEFFCGYTPAVSPTALKSMRATIKSLNIPRQTPGTLAEIARQLNPLLRGWIAYYGPYIAQVLVPTLKPGDVVILDNLSSHKRPAAGALIEAAGATMVFLPPYSPDFNPIEKAFSKLKAHLRKAAERTVSGLWDMIGTLVHLVAPKECRNYFNSCAYDPA